MSKVCGLTEAVAELVHDGDTVAMEGFTHLIPLLLVMKSFASVAAISTWFV